MSGQKMFRRRYTLAKDTPKLAAGTAIHFDPFRGDYTNDLFGRAVERFSMREVENSEWFTPDSDLSPFRPQMIDPEKISSHLADDVCVLVTVESQHNDMCDFCRNAREAITDTEAEVLILARQILKRTYEAGSLEPRLAPRAADASSAEVVHDLIRDPSTGRPRLVKWAQTALSGEEPK